MTSKRWDEIKDIFSEALNRPAEQRVAFVSSACGPDDDLRREVESLLESYEQAGDFIGANTLDSGLSTDRMGDSAIGRRIGTYRIVREIGRGGMGAVYLARRDDDEFEKQVAIKLIRRGLDMEVLIRRFRNERQILANLDHPNIARLLDGGTTEDGLPYVVMEFVEGQPLHRYCDERNLTVSERLKLFIQVAAAVHYAHQNAVAHRDLKPTNILVAANGTPKLLDFGIAKLMEPGEGGGTADPTTATFPMMTPAYASPEQLRGESAGPSSDIYSLGVLLYELVSGHRPARGRTRLWESAVGGDWEDAIEKPSAIVTRTETQRIDGLDVTLTPESVSALRGVTADQLRAQLAGPLDNVIMKAMRAEARHRYTTPAELVDDLRRYLDGLPVAAPTYVVAPLIAHERARGTTTTGPLSLAVLPFKMLNPEDRSDEYLGIGMADALITKLTNIRRIQVRPTSSVIKFAVGSVELTAAARELDVRFILDGRIQRSAEHVRVTVQLVSGAGAPMWATKFDEKFTDILNLEDSISEQVAHALIQHLTLEENELLHKHGTQSIKAYQAYLKGRYYWSSYTEDSLAQALLCFMQALTEDPDYAHAHAGVADYHSWLGVWGILPSVECFAAAKQSALRALELDPSLAEAHASLGFALWAHDREWDRAEREFQRALELNPAYAPAYKWYAYLSSARGRHADAITKVESAHKHDPLSPIMGAAVTFVFYNARQYDRCLEELHESLKVTPDFYVSLQGYGWAYCQKGMHAEAIAASRRAVALANGKPLALWTLGHCLAAGGQTVEAREVLRQLLDLSNTRHVPPYYIAVIYAALNEIDRAFEWLEKAWEEKDWWLMFIAVEPRLDPLRSDPRFREMLRRLRLDSEDTATLRVATIPAQPAPVVAPARNEVAAASNAPALAAKRRQPYLVAALVVLALVAGGALFSWMLSRPSATFEKHSMVRLNTNGNAVHAAISPDGKYVAYALQEGGQQALWMRQVSVSSSIRINAPREVHYRGLDFSRDGATLFYAVQEENNRGHGTIFQTPVLGGHERKVADDVQSAIAISPDSRELAFVRQNDASAADELIIVNTESGEERKLAVRKHPLHFAWSSSPTWSPDGKEIAVAIEGTDAQGYFANLVRFQVKDGTQKLLSRKRWRFVERLAWLSSGKGVLLVAQEPENRFQQLWEVSMRDGQARRVTNDLSDYLGVSLTGSSQELVSVQYQTLANIWTAPGDQPEKATQITPSAGRYYDLTWTPDGGLVYASDGSDTVDLWFRKADGSAARQLTTAARRNYAPATSPDGRFVVFHSDRGGNWNIWRTDATGGTAQALIPGNQFERNWPQVTPDSRSVIYQQPASAGIVHLWKVPIEGGTPVRITDYNCTRPAVSPRDGAIACWYSETVAKPKWQIAVVPPNGGPPSKIFDFAPTVSVESALHWTADGKGVTYVDNSGGASNIWVQPMDGSRPRSLTNFKTSQIFSLAWARDGRLAYSRGMLGSDVVLIRNEP